MSAFGREQTSEFLKPSPTTVYTIEWQLLEFFSPNHSSEICPTTSFFFLSLLQALGTESSSTLRPTDYLSVDLIRIPLRICQNLRE